MSARSSLTRMRTPRHGVDLEPLVEPVQLAVKWPEASEALTRTPPRLLGDTSVPGDRAHPGGVLGNATAECRRCVPGETRPSHSFHTQSRTSPARPAAVCHRGPDWLCRRRREPVRDGGNDPTGLRDPSGLEPITLSAGAAIAIVCVAGAVAGNGAVFAVNGRKTTWTQSADNALAEMVIGLFKTEEIHRRGPWKARCPCG